MSFRRELIEDVAKALKLYGYRVYLAKSGLHGFYTDGKRVVSFQYDLGGVRYSGNYSTNRPYETGTGWGLGEYMVISPHTAQQFITAHAPHWAVRDAAVTYTTPEAFLKKYGASSQYAEFGV